MTDEHKSTRLGDLLVERGIITRLQLAHAVELQQLRRQHAIKVNAPNSYTQELGELLIELGFINRNQLKSSLSWQRRLRKTTAMMVFVAPLLTAACGGGGGGGTSPGNNTQSPTASSQAVLEAAKNNSSAISSSSAPVVSSSSFSSKSSSAASSTSIVNGPVHVNWMPPKHRKNGEFLDITEVGGYELRYKLTSDEDYTSIVIKDSYIDHYYFDHLKGEYEFQVAAFDTNGLYSSFVPIRPK